MPSGQQGARRAFFAGQVNLATANTPYNIVALVNAVIQAEGASSALQTIGSAPRIAYVESHPGIDNSGGNTNDILVGEQIAANAGSLLTNLRYGRVLRPGDGFTWQSTIDNTDFLNYSVQSAANNQKLNVFISNA